MIFARAVQLEELNYKFLSLEQQMKVKEMEADPEFTQCESLREQIHYINRKS